MKLSRGFDKMFAGRSAAGWAKRTLQTAVFIAVASSVPAAWSAGAGPVNVAAASNPSLHINNVAYGSANFSTTGSVTTVTTGGRRTIINYDYLSVDAGTTLDFVQPTARSRVFNRIGGGTPTAIDGTVISNGIVYFVNNAGIIFGNGAVIQTGGFMAAASHLSDGDFLAGRDNFTNSGGSVTNYGTIQARNVSLVGANVANFGAIVAGDGSGHGGIVTMTAGTDVYIGSVSGPTDSPHILVKVSNNTASTTAGTGVTNGGTISAGEIELGAGDLYAAGIYNSGTIKGQSITLNSGASTTETNGTIDATSATGVGGTVEILGDKVAVTGGTVDASGTLGGGTVLIGGDAQGLGSVPTSQVAYVGSSATVSADATVSGTGGKVVVFAEDTARIYGGLNATGANGGSGGYVETSGKKGFDISITPNVGSGGEWLIDPNDLEIVSGGGSPNESNNNPFETSNNTASLGVNLILSALTNGTTVLILTENAGTNSQAGNITWDSTAPLLYNSNGTATLQLQAAGSISIAANISNNSANDNLNLILLAGTFANGTASNSTNKDITISGNINLANGTFTSSGANFTNTGAIEANLGINILQTGAVALQNNLNATSSGAVNIAGSSVVQSTAGAITASTLAIHTTGIDSVSGDAVKLDQAGNAFGTLDISSTGANAAVDVVSNVTMNLTTVGSASLPTVSHVTVAGVTVSDTATLPAFGSTSGITTANGSVTISDTGGITLTNPINAGTGAVSITATTGNINGSGTNAIIGGNITLDAVAGGIGGSGAVVMTPSGNVSITTGGANGAGNATVDFTGAISASKITTLTNTNGSQTNLTFSLTSNGTFTVDSGLGTTAENMVITTTSGNITGASTIHGASITLNSNGSINSIVDTAGNIALSAGSTITLSTGADALATSQIISISAGTSPITLTTTSTFTVDSSFNLGGGDLIVNAAGITVNNTNILTAHNATLVSSVGISVAGTLTLTGNLNTKQTTFDLASTGSISSVDANIIGSGVVTFEGGLTATGVARLAGTSVIQSTGLITAPTLGVTVTGDTGGVSIGLNLANVVGTFAADASTATGTIGFTSAGNLTLGSVTGIAALNGVPAFTALSSVQANNQDIVIASGGKLTISGNVAADNAGTGGNATLSATGNIVWTSGVVSGDNVSLTATGGAIGANGSPVQISTGGAVSLTTTGLGNLGNIYVLANGALALSNVTLSTDSTSDQTISIASTGALTIDTAFSSPNGGSDNDDIILSGSTVSFSGGSVAGNNVTLSATAGDLNISGAVTASSTGLVTLNAVGGAVLETAGGSVTSQDLVASSNGVNTGAAINLGQTNSITGTFAASATGVGVSGGKVVFLNSGGFTVGTLGSVTGVVSTNHDISLTDSTGSITVNQAVNAGTGNATVNGGTTIVGGSGVVTGGNVSLIAVGDIGASGAGVNTASTGLLSLSGANIFVVESNSLTTAGTRLAVTTASGDTLDLTASSISITNSFGTDGSSPLALRTTTGAITATGGTVLTASDLILDSKTSIGTALNPVTVALGGTLTVSSQATALHGGDIFVSSGGDLDLASASVTGTANQTVSFTAANITSTTDFDAGANFLVLTATSATGGLTIGNSITASTITVKTDDIFFSSGGAFLTGATGTISISPNSGGVTSVGIGPGIAPSAGRLSIDSGLLAASTAQTFTISAGASGSMAVGVGGAVDLSAIASPYNLVLQAPGGLNFQNTLTLASGLTFTLTSPGGVTDTTTAGVQAIVISGGTLVITGTTADIGSAGSPLQTEVANLGGVTGTGNLFLINKGALNVSGDVILTGGTGNNSLATASPLTISANMSVAGNLTLTAGDTPATPGDTLTVTKNVTATGNISLQAGDGIVLSGGIISTTLNVSLVANHENDLTDGGAGNISQTGTAGIHAANLTASATTGIILTGSNNQIGSFSASNVVDTFPDAASGNISLTNTGTTGLALFLGKIENDASGGSVNIVTTGAVTQSANITLSITTNGGNLIVQTKNASGSPITLTNTGNDFGTGDVTLQVLDASGNPTVFKDVAITANTQLHIQEIESGANVTLSGTTIDQAGGDAVGIAASNLSVLSSGNVGLTNANNTFTSLQATDGGAGLSLQYTTSSNGLSILGFSQNTASAATFTDTNGAITSTAILAHGTVTLNAKGGISLSNTSNSFTGLTANNTTSGSIAITDGAAVNVGSISQTASNTTSLTDAGGITVSGPLAAGTGLVISVPNSGGTFTSTAGANITANGTVSITADGMTFTTGSVIGANGTVTLKPFTTSEAIAINGSSGGVLNISNAALNSITAPSIVLGSTSQTGDISATGALLLPENLVLITGGNISLAGATITSAANAQLQALHNGTFSLATATLNGGLLEASTTGSGAGGLVTLSGTLNTNDSAVAFNSQVQLTADAAINTVGSTGADIAFNFVGATSISSSAAGNNLTLTAGAGNITFASPVGAVGSELGTLQVVSAKNVTLPAVNAAGENINNSGTLTINATQTLGSGGFVQTSATGVTLGGNILTNGTLAGGNITFNSPVTLSGARTLDSTNGGATAGGTVTIDGAVTGGSNSFTVVAGVSGVSIGANITTTSTFNSSGANFTNTGAITAHGVTINQTGLVQLQGALASTGFAVGVTGVGITSNANGAISGSTITLAGGSGNVILGATITGSGLFTSTGAAFTNTAGITGVGANITQTGAVNIDGALAGGSGAVKVSGVGLTSNANGTISGAAITLGSGSGDVNLGGVVTGSGLFTSSGAAFTNTANITSVGANITQTGAVNIDGALAGGSGDVGISGTTITANGNGTIGGANITLISGGLVSLGAQVTGSGNFTSNGTTFSEVGVSATGITLNHTGLVTLNGNMTATGNGTVSIAGAGVTQSSGIINAGKLGLTGTGTFALTDNNTVGTIAANITGPLTYVNNTALTVGTVGATSGITTNGGLISLTVNSGNLTVSQALASGAGTISLIASSGNVAVNANATTSSTFISNGTAFTNTGAITAAGITLNETGLVTIDGALASSGSPVSIIGVGITSNANGTIGGSTITLAAGSGNISLGGTITGTGLFKSTGAAFTNSANITSAGANITQTGAVNIDGALADGGNAVVITGVGITSNATGTINAGNVTLTGGSGTVTVGGVINSSGVFISTGAAFTNNASISSAGANITQTGAVNINQALADGGSPVIITGDGITSGANGAISGSTITLNSGSGDVVLNGSTNGSGLFTSTGVNFTNNGTITGVGVTLTHSGVVTLDNTVSAGSGGLSITGASAITDASSTLSGVGVTLHSSGAIGIGGLINATGAVALTSDTSSVSATGGVNGLSAILTGNTSVAVGAVTTTGGNITLIGPTSITLGGDLNAGSSNVSVQGPAILGANVTVTGSAVDFVNAITGAGKSLTVDASGLTTFGGDVGTVGSPIASLITDFGGSTTLNGSVFGTGAVALNDAVLITGATTVSGGTVAFGSTITGGGTGSLVVNSTTSSTFNGTIGVGGGNALTTLTVTGGPATFAAPTITTTGNQTYSANILFTTAAVLGGTNFSFSGNIDSTGTAVALTIDAGGTVSLTGTTGGVNPLSSLTVHGSTLTTLGQSITTTGDVSVGGPINIGANVTSTGGNISLPGVVTLTGNTAIVANGATGISFGLGGISGSDNLSFTSNSADGKIIVGAMGSGTLNPTTGVVTLANRVGNVVFDSGGVVQLNGNIFALSLKFAYKNDGASPMVSPIATVYSANGDLILSTNGTFDMEQNQSLSVFGNSTLSPLFGNTPTGIGNLSIVSNNHPIFLGDLSAAGSITVNAGSVGTMITIRGRASAQMDQSAGGPVTSQAVSIVSGLLSQGALNFKGNLNVFGTGVEAKAQFSSDAATNDIQNKAGQLQINNVTQILDFNSPPPAIPATKFVLVVGGVPEALNQVVSGEPTPPQTQVNVVPRDVQTLEPEREEAISGALKDALLELGIFARDLRTDELIEYLVGTALYDDVPYKLDPTPQDTQMAANRLPYAPVLPTVEAYRALFLKPELDDKGNPVLDANGKPKMVAQDNNIKNAFGQSWLAYTRDLKEKAIPDGFRGYLEGHANDDKKDATALLYLNQLRDLLNQITNLGLTDTEFDVSKKVLLAKVRPANIKEEDFFPAIMGPSTQAKNMTAMK